MKGRKGIWAALILTVAVAFGWSALQKSPQEQVTARFQADRAHMETLAQQVVTQGSTQGIVPPEGWRDIQLYNAGNDFITVEFDFGGSGFGSETAYWGVNYVPYGTALGFQGQRWDYWRGQENGRLYYDPEGDNTCYVEELAPCWYYYEMRF